MHHENPSAVVLVLNRRLAAPTRTQYDMKQAKQKTYFWRFNQFAPWCMTSARKSPESTFCSQIKHPSRPMQEPWTAKSGKVALFTLFRNNDSCVVKPAGLRYPPVNLISTIRSFQKLDNGCDFWNCLQCLHPSQRCKGSSKH